MSSELPPTVAEPLLTITEVARAMRVSKMTVYRLVHDGSLPALRIARSLRVPAGALQDYLVHHRVTTA
jgi:excisionase family DNA binding protein